MYKKLLNSIKECDKVTQFKSKLKEWIIENIPIEERDTCERKNNSHVVKLLGANIELPRPQLQPHSTYRTSVELRQIR